MEKRHHFLLRLEPAELRQASILRRDEGNGFPDPAAEFRCRTVPGASELSNRAQHSSGLGPTRLDAHDVPDGDLTGLDHRAKCVQPQIHVEHRGAVYRRDLANGVRGILQVSRFDECVHSVWVRKQAIQGVTKTAKRRRALVLRRIAQRVSPVG